MSRPIIEIGDVARSASTSGFIQTFSGAGLFDALGWSERIDANTKIAAFIRPPILGKYRVLGFHYIRSAREAVLESRTSMQRAGEFLGRAIRRLERPEAALAWLAGSWPTCVGRTLAAHTRPIRCERGRLEIAADGKAWQTQLEEMERDFCARINKAWGGDLICEVKFVRGTPGSHRVPRETDH